ncbi:hypothetical protein E2C01_068744 [Portunus trituberculatus]|uniref:Uncharacterized protein n=1 Tax=Portunus trituberculatus TaxID=210409 RepID=A0A5B7HXD1_PORTR|nr:hypothetical protein [Portunus trituberculatus]
MKYSSGLHTASFPSAPLITSQHPRFHSHCTALRSQSGSPLGHHNTRLAHSPGGLRRPPLSATCCPSPVSS